MGKANNKLSKECVETCQQSAGTLFAAMTTFSENSQSKVDECNCVIARGHNCVGNLVDGLHDFPSTRLTFEEFGVQQRQIPKLFKKTKSRDYSIFSVVREFLDDSISITTPDQFRRSRSVLCAGIGL